MNTKISLLAAAGASCVLYLRALRPRLLRWGATNEEVDKPLPGDELVPEPGAQSTRAITIDAPVEDVWPWLAQMGYERGGFYSYDWLENLTVRLTGMRPHYHSVDRILPEFQHPEVGDFILSAPDRWRGRPVKFGWHVGVVEPQRVLALKNWGSFVLEPIDEGRTRLIARTRSGRDFGSRLANAIAELPHFIMERGMLLGIKKRAEALSRREALAIGIAAATTKAESAQHS